MNRLVTPVTLGVLLLSGSIFSPVVRADEPDSQGLANKAVAKKIVIMAGKPSHPPRMHEFNAGVQLLAKCLAESKSVQVEVVLNGWPQDERVFDDAAAVIFYMDGGGRHEVVQEHGRRLKLVDQWMGKGVGVGFMHYGVEVVAEQAGSEFQRWIGGHYENMFSCNPIWEPQFLELPKHPITQGVSPFQVKDEWYFNMRFAAGLAGNKAQDTAALKFWPILVATPPDDVRDGPYVAPQGPYPHIQEAKGRAEAMMWAVEHKNGARGFGFTGGHFHDNWGNADYRKVVLNALLWTAGADVPASGVESSVSADDLEANLDPKKPRKK
jgi:type 1 glutamine amidotransferase